MQRALIALFSIPLLCSAFFGVFALIAAPIMLVITAVIALPLFLILKRLHWMAWWHACISGAICGTAVTLVYWNVSPPYHIEYIGARIALFFVSLGSFVGLAFWWAGIFKNEGLPNTTRTFPMSMIVSIPIAVLAMWAYLRMEPHFVDGRALQLLREPDKKTEVSGLLTMKLSTGEIVTAHFPAGEPSWNVNAQCFIASERWAFDQSEKVYFIHGPKFGTSSNGC